MNLCIEFSPKENVCRELDSLPLDALSVPDKFYWIDIEEKNVTVEHEILKILDIERSSLENYSSQNPIPLYEQTENYINLDMLSFKIHETKVAPCKFKVILGNNFFLTLHEEPLAVIDQLKQEYERNFLIAGKTPGFLIFLIFDFYISDVLQTMLSFDREMEEIEDEISEGRFSKEVLQDIFRIRRNIIVIKKSVEPASNILMKISTRKIPFISDECRSFLKNLDSNMNRLKIDLDSFRELIIGTLEFHMSIASKRLNEVMKLLAIIATVMMPLTFVAGIYGMNFKFMPELSWPYGYYAVLGTMGIIAGSLFCVFKIKKWF